MESSENKKAFIPVKGQKLKLLRCHPDWR